MAGKGKLMNGTIKKINKERGFGFIRESGGKEYFFHVTGVTGNFNTLYEGQAVSFELEESPKGPRGCNVTGQ